MDTDRAAGSLQGKQEHEAWLDVMAELRLLGYSENQINGPILTPLIKAVERWGELLVPLRMMTTDETRRSLFTEADQAWLRVTKVF